MARSSFEVREGGAAPPVQLQRTEISNELRAVLWNVLFEQLTDTDSYQARYVTKNGTAVLRRKHIYRDFQPADEFNGTYKYAIPPLKAEFFRLRFPEFYGLLEWFLGAFKDPDFSRFVGNSLKLARAPFRLLDGDTLSPISTEEEFEAVQKGLKDASAGGLLGTASHLKSASSAASQGKWADSIRESIHAVEATAVRLEPAAKELGPALNKLEQKGLLHGGLKNGFKAIYGYTSDERGVRHSLYDNAAANVDEADALFMLGACAAFISYLIAKGRSGGLLD